MCKCHGVSPSDASARARLTRARVSAAESAVTACKYSDMKSIQKTARLSERLSAAKQAASALDTKCDTKHSVRNEKAALRIPAPSFQSLLLGVLKLHPEETQETVQGEADQLNIRAPQWVLTAVRTEQRRCGPAMRRTF